MGDANAPKSSTEATGHRSRCSFRGWREMEGGETEINALPTKSIGTLLRGKAESSETTLRSPAPAPASERRGNGGDAGSDLFKSNQAEASLSDVNSLIGRHSGRNERIEHCENPTLMIRHFMAAWNVILASYSRTEATDGALILGVESASPIERHLRVP